jgi:hypothetical protein
MKDTVRIITAEEVTEVLDAIVRDFGPGHGYRDQLVAAGHPLALTWRPESAGGCYNFTVHHGKRVPLCIVGVALDRLGVLNLVEAGHDCAQALDVIRDLSDHGIVVTDRALDLLWTAQRRQDEGKTWQASWSFARHNGFTVEAPDDQVLAAAAAVVDAAATQVQP